MLAIQPFTRAKRDEELTLVGIALIQVCHGNLATMVELDALMRFILKVFAVHRLAAGTRACRVAALHHEVTDKSVEDGVVVVLWQA